MKIKSKSNKEELILDFKNDYLLIIFKNTSYIVDSLEYSKLLNNLFCFIKHNKKIKLQHLSIFFIETENDYLRIIFRETKFINLVSNLVFYFKKEEFNKILSVL